LKDKVLARKILSTGPMHPVIEHPKVAEGQQRRNSHDVVLNRS